MRTIDGFETFGKFFVGNERDFAYSIFSKLKGKKHTNEKNLLLVELMETRYELPLNVKMLGCSLEELGENCKTIVKEIFKRKNLE